jgi:hypothetical protein
MAQPILAVASQQIIYNMALGHISVAPVSDINENSQAANALNTFWSPCVREALRAAPWDFNTVYVTLAQSGTYQIINNWAYAYQYPANCVRLWKILSPQTGSAVIGTFPGIYPNTSVNSWNGFNMARAKFKVRYDPVNNGKVILTNVAQAIGEYSVPITDVTQFDDVFVGYLSLRLAAYVCTSLINDDQKTASLIKLAEMAASNAMRMNDEEGDTDKNDENSSFLDARGGGGPVSPQFWNSPSTSQY